MTVVQLKDLGNGILQDPAPEELAPGYWSDGFNVRFTNGRVERMGGIRQVYADTSETPHYIDTYTTTTKRYLIHATLNRVYADDGDTRIDITPTTPFSASIDGRWTGGTLNGVFVISNPNDIPHYWGGDPATKLQPIPGWDATWRCKSIRPFDNYLVSLGLTIAGVSYPHRVKWSDIAEPGTIPTQWTATAENQAGEVDIAEDSDLIVDQKILGDVNVIYKENCAYGMAPTNDNNVFRFFRLPGNAGMIAPGCVAVTPKGHVVLTAGDVVIHQGQGPTSIAEGQNRRAIFDNISSLYANRSFVVVNPKYSEVWICIPQQGDESCRLAWVWNWDTGKWSKRLLPGITYGAIGQVPVSASGLAWEGDTEPWYMDITTWGQDDATPNEVRLMLSHVDKKLSLADVGGTDLGMVFTAWVERSGLTFDDPRSCKLFHRFSPRMNGATDAVVQFSMGSAMLANTQPVFEDAQTFNIGRQESVFSFTNGKYLAIRLMSQDPRPWNIRSADLEIELTGTGGIDGLI